MKKNFFCPICGNFLSLVETECFFLEKTKVYCCKKHSNEEKLLAEKKHNFCIQCGQEKT